jgi:hypothetical protein
MKNDTAGLTDEENPSLDVEEPEKDEDLPPIKRGGMPKFVFMLFRCTFTLCPFDALVIIPVILALAIIIVFTFVAIARKEKDNIIIYIVVASVLVFLIGLWLQWTQRNPRPPLEEDVLKVSMSEGINKWPRSAIAPLRGELVSKGGPWFRDQHGRRLLLRGVNCAGGTKLPAAPAGLRASHLREGFYDYKGVSFVGRPFPLEDADLHFGRLRAMGLTFLRFLITWEAVEHDGPGIYDEEYLTYLHDIIKRCADHGISVFIDLHQDVWSRWTGGDGAPAWTLEKVGFALDKLDASGAALTHQNLENGPYPKMVWNSNNARLAAGTMWTLFFAGNDFAPNTLIGTEPVQSYLQRHFIAAIGKVAEKLKDEPNVVGFDILNEPSVGFVGVDDVRDIGPNMYYIGWRVDPWSAMQMGAGETCSVDFFSSFMHLEKKKRELNTENVCAWTNGPTSCVWHQNGVWKMDESTGKPRLLKPFYFAKNPRTGFPINFIQSYGVPFWLSAAKTIRTHIPDAIIFAEPILDMTEPSKEHRPVLSDEQVGPGYCYAPHYYDGMTLMTKSFSRYMGIDSVTQRPAIGMQAIQESYGKGIANLRHEAIKMGTDGCPILIGECGIPFDLGGRDAVPVFFGHRRKAKTAFETGDFNKCTHALHRTMRALEVAQVSFTIWCYEPENVNKYGDLWNEEDLSLFSKSQIAPDDEDDLFAGGRSLLAAIRPYPQRVAGDVQWFKFSLYQMDRRFDLVFEADHSIASKETVIFLPKYQYPHGVKVSITKGGGSYQIDWDLQTLTYTHTDACSMNHIVVQKVVINEDRDDELSSLRRLMGPARRRAGTWHESGSSDGPEMKAGTTLD